MNTILKKNDKTFTEGLITIKSQDVQSIILDKFMRLPIVWPISSFVACNPLVGYEKNGIDYAIDEVIKLKSHTQHFGQYQEINQILIKWLSVYFDEGHAHIVLPHKTKGLYSSVIRLLEFDLGRGNRADLKSFVKSNSIEAINICLEKLGIHNKDLERFIEFNINQLPGWGGYIRYLCEYEKKNQDLVFDYLALRLIVTMCLYPEVVSDLCWYQHKYVDHTEANNKRALIEENEKSYQDQLLSNIVSVLGQSPQHYETWRYDAQFVFCIDPRSEPLRRVIESQGKYQTFSCAGFFNLMVNIKSDMLGYEKNSLPAILESKHTVDLRDIIGTRELQSKGREANSKKIFKSMKYSLTTPLFLVELMGPFMGFLALAKTYFKGLLYKKKKIASEPEQSNKDIKIDIDIEEQVDTAYGLLKTMGLVKNFSKFVFICGHKSSNTNNMYHNALNCGACQGENGFYNSTIFTTILNNKLVRKGLMKRGIIIPEYTRFIPAEHDTTTDRVDIVTFDSLKNSNELREIKRVLHISSKISTHRRLKNLVQDGDIKNSQQTADMLSIDWSTVRPEWGLARNASFIIGPRTITKDIDLEGRTFLHSYDYRQDEEYSLLNGIISGPLAVAYWINMQYLFSSLDNNQFGSGCKTTQNLSGGIGVMQGNYSDLQIGLPLQSVFKSYKDSYHEPVRLSVLIYAPKKYIDSIRETNQFFNSLIEGKWVHVYCIDPNSKSPEKI